MAIHSQVLVTSDRRWRIEADAAGTEFTLHAVGVSGSHRLVDTAPSVEALLALLVEYGIDVADLIPG